MLTSHTFKIGDRLRLYTDSSRDYARTCTVTQIASNGEITVLYDRPVYPSETMTRDELDQRLASIGR